MDEKERDASLLLGRGAVVLNADVLSQLTRLLTGSSRAASDRTPTVSCAATSSPFRIRWRA